MARKLAAKVLTASDLTFFEWHFRNNNAGNQKAINLNQDVFVQKLYPQLPAVALQKGGRLPLDLYIYGPGIEGELNLQRKIVKFGMYKNWRLNGEFVTNPIESPTRFNVLKPDDIAIFDFSGEIEPVACKILFLAQDIPQDQGILNKIKETLGNRKMDEIAPYLLRRLIQEANPLAEHPIYELILDEALEDAAQNGYEGVRKLLTRPSGRKMSLETLQRARENADLAGQQGENYVNSYLESLKNQGKVKNFEWVSLQNSIAPNDFLIEYDDIGSVEADSKATTGEFERNIHVSVNELRQMTISGRYDIFRVYEMNEKTAKMRVAENVGDFAKKILEIFDQLPKGVTPDSISISPETLAFNPEVIEIEIPDDNGDIEG